LGGNRFVGMFLVKKIVKETGKGIKSPGDRGGKMSEGGIGWGLKNRRRDKKKGNAKGGTECCY